MIWLTGVTRYRRLQVVLVCCMAMLLVAWPRASQNTNRPRNEEGPGGKDVAAREVLVKFRPGHIQQNVESAELEVDAEPAESVGRGEVRLLRSRSKNVIDMVNVLSRRGDVEYAEPNYIVHAILTPNDPSFGQLWGLLNTGQTIGGIVGTAGADIHATSAWDVTTGSRANVVAVIDTGIDYTHPDLAANVWTAPTAFTVVIAGLSISCPAGAHGFNAITNTCNPADDNNHGTHVSGTIGAVGNNGTGVAGVNWTASIMAGKFLDAAGSGSTANAINAIEFAIQAKAIFGAQANVRVLSNSWGGGGFSQALMDEIAKANANGMLFVAAAGNNGTNNDTTPQFPSNYNVPNVVAVAATDNRDGIASFSDFGPTTVHLGAPGVNVLSTIRGGGFSTFSGTSMATPHVSGAAALVLSVCALDTAALKTKLLNTVDPIASLASRTITGGRLNVSNAVNTCAAPPTPDFTVSATPASRTVTQGGGTSYTVTVTPTGGFTGTVTLSLGPVPAGATGSFSPASITTSGTSTLTVNTAATTPTGSFPLTITGTSGTAHTAPVTLVVNAPPVPDFTVSATPASRTVTQGGGTSYTVTVTPTGGFTGTVTLSVSGLPSGAGGSFAPASVTSGTSTLTVTTAAATPPGSFPLTITASDGTITHTAPVTLVVNSPTPTDTVKGTRADYFAGNRRLRLAATSTSSTATLTAFVTSTNQLIGTLTNQGGGVYSRSFTWPVNPQNVKFVSSAGGTATMAVTLR